MPQHFLALLRYSLGNPLEPCLTDGSIDWHATFEDAKRHCVAGITYIGVEKLSKLDPTPPGQWTAASLEQGQNSPQEALPQKGKAGIEPSFSKPPVKLLLDWIGETRKNEKRNKQLDEQCSRLCRIFAGNGFRNSIIKGQGVAQLYTTPSYRSPGDIDIWVEGSREEIITFVRSKIGDKKVDICSKHIEMPVWDGTTIEVHFIPSELSSPFANHKLKRFFCEQADACHKNEITTAEGHSFTAATIAFDSVQILTHILGHFLYEGIGLRQIIDYYFVLTHLPEQMRSVTASILQSLGLSRFTSAMMYVLHTALGLPDEYLIAPMNERYGKILLEEILQGGNFGKSSALVNDKNHAKPLWRFVQHTKRQFQFFRIVPAETCWSFYQRIVTYFWRLSHGYIK